LHAAAAAAAATTTNDDDDDSVQYAHAVAVIYIAMTSQ